MARGAVEPPAVKLQAFSDALDVVQDLDTEFHVALSSTGRQLEQALLYSGRCEPEARDS
jgi:hypothetical protein